MGGHKFKCFTAAFSHFMQWALAAITDFIAFIDIYNPFRHAATLWVMVSALASSLLSRQTMSQRAQNTLNNLKKRKMLLKNFRLETSHHTPFNVIPEDIDV
jgi:hypothetical protein